jgi:hypothetical protein
MADSWRLKAASVFEQIIERRTRVIGAPTPLAGCFFFYHHADGIERAVVAFIFGRDSGGNGLIALEAAGWIEVFALFAGVQVETAFRALSDWVRKILQQRTAFRAAGDGPRAWHVDRPGPEGVFFLNGRGLFEFLFPSSAGILVSALPIFAVGQRVSPNQSSVISRQSSVIGLSDS